MSFFRDGIIDFWKGFAFGVKLYIKCSFFALVLDGGDGDGDGNVKIAEMERRGVFNEFL
jgi:hypothetical protein